MSLSEMLRRYEADHRHPMNRRLHKIGIPMILISLVLIPRSWPLALGLFVLGWVLQFVGHLFEGKKPSFLNNPLYLWVGVCYFLLPWLRPKPEHQDLSLDDQ